MGRGVDAGAGGVMPIQKFAGYAPDADPTTPGVIVDCAMMEPSVRGMKAAPSASGTGLPALAATCNGAALMTRLDGTKRLFAGTQTAIYEAGSSTWNNRSSATYVGSADGRWQFRQFGNVSIAQNGIDEPQVSTVSVFSNITAMPIASLIETVSGFVMAANITDVSYPHADGWWCSALYDHTNWTPSIATQSAQGRLLDTPGAITALKAIGSDVVAFKQRSMYLGRYVGPDVIWSWQQVPGDLGAFSQSGVVSDGAALYWWGGDDFYRFDGSRPLPIGGVVRKWFARTASQQYLYKMQGGYDKERGLVRWYFVESGDTAPESCIVFNVKTGQWGRADRSIEAVVDFVSAAITFDTPGILDTLLFSDTTYTQSFDSPFWLASSESPSVFNTSHLLQSLTGVAGSSSITSGDFGDDDGYSLLRRVRPRYSTAPATASLTNYHKADAGDSVTADQTVSADDGKFDILQSARWHRVKFDWTGDTEVSGFNADLQPEGER